MTSKFPGLFLKDYLFEEPLEVYAVPIGPSYIKPNTYTSTQPQSYISSKSDSSLTTSFDSLGSLTYPVIPKSSLSRSSSKLRVSPTYRHIPLRTEHKMVKNAREEEGSRYFPMKEKQKRANPVPPLENSHPHASFLPPPDSIQEKAHESKGSDEDWIPGGLVDYSDYTSSDYILDYLEKTFYQLPDYSDFFSEELAIQHWPKSPSSNISPRSSEGLQTQTSQLLGHSQPSTVLAPSRLVVSEPDLGSNSYDRRLIVEVPSDQPPGDPLANLVGMYLWNNVWNLVGMLNFRIMFTKCPILLLGSSISPVDLPSHAEEGWKYLVCISDFVFRCNFVWNLLFVMLYYAKHV